MAYVPQQPVVTQFQPSPAPSSPSLPSPTQQTAALLPVVQQAQQMSNQAATMAQRGMFYSANSELIKALTLISQSLDVQQGTAAHATALTAGLTALEEARDFAASGSQKGGGTNVAAIAATHQTKLPTPIAPGVGPVAAQQQYFGFAQNQLMIAAGGLPASSDILYRLGRLQTALAAHDNDSTTLHGPQALVFHQAALATDANNWLAANELGVLYVRYGQLPQARQLLVQSVTLHPHRQGWQNLAVLHRRLGENDLAQRAEAEIQLLDKQQGQPADANNMVRWVDTKTFAASGGGDANWPAAAVAAKPATTTAGSTRR
jgi:tetratricopeptide (TPR) repeat protein